jgi:DNA anti-recombination protein RmuC
MMNLTVDRLRDEFKQMAFEGGRQGAQMVINGEDMAELRQDLEKKERKLLELKMEKEKLENDLCSQKEKNEELELLVDQQERHIRLLENEVCNIKKILNTQKTDLEKEEALRKMKEEKAKSLRKKEEENEEALRKGKEDKAESLRKMKEEKEEALRKRQKDKMLSEIMYLKRTCSGLKSHLLMKKCAGNISRTEMEKLRVQIAEMKEKPKERKYKKS